MTSLHRKWSPKVAVATTKKDDGGVAACLNWSYGTKPAKPKDEEKRQNDILQFQEAVDKVLLEMQANKENDERRLLSPDPSVLSNSEDMQALSSRASVSRIEGRLLAPAAVTEVLVETQPPQSRRNTALEVTRNTGEFRQPSSPGKCLHVAPNERIQINKSNTHTQLQTVEVATNTAKQPLDSTRKFLKKYFNRPLSDEELKHVLRETHKRISDDLVEAALQQRSKRDTELMQRSLVPRPPPPGRSPSGKHGDFSSLKQGGTERAVAIPQKQYQLDLTDNNKQRPSSAHCFPSNNAVKNTGSCLRPGSASLTRRSPEIKSPNRHFSAWRPNGIAPRCGWTQSSNNYEDLWRLATKYKTKRREAPKLLGASRYNNKHIEAESQYFQFRPSSQQGKVSLQLNCCEDSDMTINIRVQKSRAGSHY